MYAVRLLLNFLNALTDLTRGGNSFSKAGFGKIYFCGVRIRHDCYINIFLFNSDRSYNLDAIGTYLRSYDKYVQYIHM